MHTQSWTRDNNVGDVNVRALTGINVKKGLRISLMHTSHMQNIHTYVKEKYRTMHRAMFLLSSPARPFRPQLRCKRMSLK
ncbi:9124_t:CDS:2, partial [Dentiscutata heterogama]